MVREGQVTSGRSLVDLGRKEKSRASILPLSRGERSTVVEGILSRRSNRGGGGGAEEKKDGSG